MKLKLSLAMAALLLAGCTRTDPERIKETRLLPRSAIVLEDLGNNWMVLEIHGRKYLYRARRMAGNSATEVLAPY